ncbi:MAG: hypothetical protein FWE19_06970 [Oscillospiraceae bacterium]|nr:hypothetical protein [Oscillospiraceae bacterium]
MTQEQLMGQIMSQSRDIAALWESSKSAHRRIDENDRLAKGIHKLAANIEALALQVKLLTQRMDSTVERMEKSLKSQGERIGAVEGTSRAGERHEQSISALERKVEALEREPSIKWKAFVSQMLAILAAVVAGIVLTRLLGADYYHYLYRYGG